MQVDLSYDRSAALAEGLLSGGISGGEEYRIRGYFAKLFAAWEVMLLVLFVWVTVYVDDVSAIPEAPASAASVALKYYAFQQLHVMIFVGFGFLMTFLRKHAYSAVGFTFLVTAFTIQWYILCNGCWRNVFGEKVLIELSLDSFIFGDFAAATVLITYGVLLGKVSAGQLLFISILETVAYSFNEIIAQKVLFVTDLGGTLLIHMFGAFFGMSCALFFQPRKPVSNDDNKSVYHSDTFAMIGTIFLWLFWPSFNALLATTDTALFQRIVINTVLSLTGSCVGAFLFSYYYRGMTRFDMLDVQNATLAGGVSIGSLAGLISFDHGAGLVMAIGFVSGIISVWSYVTFQPFLQRTLGLYDTRGVNNLHGIPSLLGAAGVGVATFYCNDNLGPSQLELVYWKVFTGEVTPKEQALQQFLFIAVTLGISIASGAITGLIVRQCEFLDPTPLAAQFNDEAFWNVPFEETPDYFSPKLEAPGAPTLDSLEQRILVIEKLVQYKGSSRRV
eukprot:gb/GEZN01003687.1/.p1 GENE.gb/GEZN01003687.1/~~gb/GEZN01003687.1/.p1  ORF type:complete len:503 (+),score=54.90 gb/GEZN01003687.1/:93-1601(+)